MGGIQVIGVGMPRTGTKSLNLALHRLGYNETYHCTSMAESAIDDYEKNGDWLMWFDAFEKSIAARKKGEVADIDFEPIFDQKRNADRYIATVDAPGVLVWKELIKAYPDAVVLLHERDFESWYESVNATIIPRVNKSFARDSPLYHMTAFGSYLFGEDSIFKGKFESDVEFVKKALLDHHDEVKRTVPKEKLLVFKVSDGWKPLCEFLGKDIPRDPDGNEQQFPKSNERVGFLGRSKEMEGGSMPDYRE